MKKKQLSEVRQQQAKLVFLTNAALITGRLGDRKAEQSYNREIEQLKRQLGKQGRKEKGSPD